MTIITVTPPNGEAVSLSEARDYLRIGHEGEDALVQHLIEARGRGWSGPLALRSSRACCAKAGVRGPPL